MLLAEPEPTKPEAEPKRTKTKIEKAFRRGKKPFLFGDAGADRALRAKFAIEVEEKGFALIWDIEIMVDVQVLVFHGASGTIVGSSRQLRKISNINPMVQSAMTMIGPTQGTRITLEDRTRELFWEWQGDGKAFARTVNAHARP